MKERSTEYDAFCIISHQVTNGFELVRINGGNGCHWFARWGVFSSKFRQMGIDCRKLPGFTLFAAPRRSDRVRAEFNLVEFLKNATLDQVQAVKSILCVFVVGEHIDTLYATVREDSSQIPMEDRSGHIAGPGSGKRLKRTGTTSATAS